MSFVHLWSSSCVWSGALRRSCSELSGPSGRRDSCECLGRNASIQGLEPPTGPSLRGLFRRSWALPRSSPGPGRPAECTPEAVPSQAPRPLHVVVSCPAQPPYLGRGPVSVEIRRRPVDRLRIPCGRPVDRCVCSVHSGALWVPGAGVGGPVEGGKRTYVLFYQATGVAGGAGRPRKPRISGA